MHPVAGTATAGADFKADPVTLTWGHGDASPKQVLFPIVQDLRTESTETFSIELTNATGGAVIVSPSRVTIAINDSLTDSSSSGGSDGGGGGHPGGLGALLLGLVALCRRLGRSR